MKRQALLLETFAEKVRIRSAYSDIEAMRAFLLSNCGGAWDAHEIQERKNPKRRDILAIIDAAKDVDYFLLLYVGTGEFVKMNRPWREVRLHLNSEESISEGELNPGSQRCTFVLDCCGKKASANAVPFMVPPSLQGLSGKASNYRQLYEQSLGIAESGLVKFVATFSNDHLMPSLTQCLLNQVSTWAPKDGRILDLKEMAVLIKEALGQDKVSQNIEYVCGRRLHHFPFAVAI